MWTMFFSFSHHYFIVLFQFLYIIFTLKVNKKHKVDTPGTEDKQVHSPRTEDKHADSPGTEDNPGTQCVGFIKQTNKSGCGCEFCD